MNFQVPGKWILCGEHSVLRGAPALVFPLFAKTLELKVQIDDPSSHLNLETSVDQGPEFNVLFWNVMDCALKISNASRNQLKGKVSVKSNIPIGSGLGASAALCVAIGKWFERENIISNSEIYEFSKKLEDLFHGESSGVDIAIALSGQGLKFIRNGDRSKIQSLWKPNLYLSYSGRKGVTLECVNKVKEFIRLNPELGMKIDDQMRESVKLAESSLMMEPSNGLDQLKEAIKLAAGCFDSWGLSPKEHILKVLEMGALAAKPTGSGGGGYVLSLWKSTPPEAVKNQFIPCFVE